MFNSHAAVRRVPDFEIIEIQLKRFMIGKQWLQLAFFFLNFYDHFMMHMSHI